MELIKCERFRAKISPETCRIRKEKAAKADPHGNFLGIASFAECVDCEPEGMRKTRVEVGMGHKVRSGIVCKECGVDAAERKVFETSGLCKRCYDRAYKREKKKSQALIVPSANLFPSLVEQGIKHDGDKLRYDLVPPEALEEVVKVLTFGAAKYTDRNWEKGINYGRVYGALMRHMQAFWRGEDIDIESGLSHLSHAGCCLFFLLTYDRRGMMEFDDRPSMATIKGVSKC